MKPIANHHTSLVVGHYDLFIVPELGFFLFKQIPSSWPSIQYQASNPVILSKNCAPNAQRLTTAFWRSMDKLGRKPAFMTHTHYGGL
jgi:hypothetical protein